MKQNRSSVAAGLLVSFFFAACYGGLPEGDDAGQGGGSTAAGGGNAGGGSAAGGGDTGGGSATGGGGDTGGGGEGGGGGGSSGGGAGGAGGGKPQASFFITSTTGSGNLGGLSGADARCQRLAADAGFGARTWRAYLSAYSTDGGQPTNARSRIGSGPWFNVKGVRIAASVTALHQSDAGINKDTALTEKGAIVNGGGMTPNQHDILTGSTASGNVQGTATCKNWTSSETSGVSAQVGHHDRAGGGTNATSWNSAHASSGCSASDLVSTAGAGRYYCFAAD